MFNLKYGRDQFRGVAKAGIRPLWVLAILTAAMPSLGRAAAHYVSPQGSDSNPGTQSRPWRTLSRVSASRFSPGDRILLEGGQAFDGSLTLDERSASSAGNPIVIGSYGRGRAVIRAGPATAILVRNLGGIVIRELVVTGAGGGANRGFGVEVVNERGTTGLDDIWIENLEVSGFHWAGIYVGGAPDLPGVRQAAAGRYGFENVRISRSLAHHNLYYGIWVSGPWTQDHWGYANRDVAISDCIAHDNPGDPAYKENHSGNGILLDDTDGGSIEHSTAYHNGETNGSLQGGPVGIWTDESNRVTIQFCESYSNRTGGSADGGGFDLDGGVTNSRMQYNYSHDNDGAGYLVWNYGGAIHPLAHNVVRYNVSENDVRKHRYGGITVGSFGEAIRDLEVYNNTVFISSGSGAEARSVWIARGSPGIGIRFRNNLLISDGGAPLVEIESDKRDVLFQGNAYWARQGAFAVIEAGKTYVSLKDWRQATGQERLDGREIGMSPAAGVTQMGSGQTIAGLGPLSELAAYRLLPGSPLIDAGLDLGAEFGLDVGTQDFWGTPIPQGKAFDIGACEAPGR